MVYDTEPMVLPWNAPRKTITPWRPDAFRASLMPASTASAPEFMKKSLSMLAGVRSRTFSAASTSES